MYKPIGRQDSTGHLDLEEFEKFFKAVDKDGDGTLTKEECLVWIEQQKA